MGTLALWMQVVAYCSYLVGLLVFFLFFGFLFFLCNHFQSLGMILQLCLLWKYTEQEKNALPVWLGELLIHLTLLV